MVQNFQCKIWIANNRFWWSLVSFFIFFYLFVEPIPAKKGSRIERGKKKKRKKEIRFFLSSFKDPPPYLRIEKYCCQGPARNQWNIKITIFQSVLSKKWKYENEENFRICMVWLREGDCQENWPKSVKWRNISKNLLFPP